MSQAYVATNFATTTLAADITTNTQTAITLTSGSNWPSPTGGDYTMMALAKPDGTRELVCIVARSGNIVTVGIPGSAAANSAGRGYEGTTATTFISGNAASCVASAALTTAALGHVGDAVDAHAATAISNAPTAPLVATTVQAAIDALAARTFPAGTRMTFNQTAAPTGWTKDTTAGMNDAALRIVVGAVASDANHLSGGADAFTTLFGAAKSTNGYALLAADMPSHAHTFSGTSSGQSNTHYHDVGSTAQRSSPYGAQNYYFSGSGAGNYSGAANADHTHTYSGTTSYAGSSGTHAHALSNMNLKYVDLIVAQKD